MKRKKSHSKASESEINKIVRMVVKHLHGDIKDFGEEAEEDRQLIRHLKPHSRKKSSKKKSSSRSKIGKVMEEYKMGDLHSGSKRGPKVKSRKQALAIAFSEARRGKKKRRKK